MQTKLRIVGMLFAASLPWASLTSAATPPQNKQQAKPSTKLASRPQATKKISTAHTFRPMGVASWYGKEEQGHKMANGQRFDRRKLTAASWTVPLGTRIRVVNVKNGNSVVVTVTDRGPNHRLHRLLDLSEAAAKQLDYVDKGLTTVFFSAADPMETAHMEITSSLIEPSADTLVASATASEMNPRLP